MATSKFTPSSVRPARRIMLTRTTIGSILAKAARRGDDWRLTVETDVHGDTVAWIERQARQVRS